jgi:hypothetical protein
MQSLAQIMDDVRSAMPLLNKFWKRSAEVVIRMILKNVLLSVKITTQAGKFGGNSPSYEDVFAEKCWQYANFNMRFVWYMFCYKSLLNETCIFSRIDRKKDQHTRRFLHTGHKPLRFYKRCVLFERYPFVHVFVVGLWLFRRVNSWWVCYCNDGNPSIGMFETQVVV